MSRYNHRKQRQVTGNPKEIPVGDHERPKSEIVSKAFVDTFLLGDSDNMPRPTVHRIRKSARSFMEFDNSCQWIEFMKNERPPSPFSSRCSIASRPSKDSVIANDETEGAPIADKPAEGAASDTSAAEKSQPSEGHGAWMRDQMAKLQDQQKALQQQQDNLMSLITASEHRMDARDPRDAREEPEHYERAGAEGVLFERQAETWRVLPELGSDARRVMSVRGTVQGAAAAGLPRTDPEDVALAHPLLPGPPVGSLCPNDYLHPGARQHQGLRARPALPAHSNHATLPATPAESRNSLTEDQSNGSFPLGAGEPRKFRRRIKGGRAAAYAERMEGSAGNLIYNRGPRPDVDESYATMEESNSGLQYDEDQSFGSAHPMASQPDVRDTQSQDSHVKDEGRMEDIRNPSNIPASFLKGTGVWAPAAGGSGNPGSYVSSRRSTARPPVPRPGAEMTHSGGHDLSIAGSSAAPSPASSTAAAPAAAAPPNARAQGRANARRNHAASSELHDPDSDRAAAGMGSSVPFWERDGKAAHRPASATASATASHASSRAASSAAASVKAAASGSSVRAMTSRTTRSARAAPAPPSRSAQPTPNKEQLGQRSASPAPAPSATVSTTDAAAASAQ